MSNYLSLTKEALRDEFSKIKKQYEELKLAGLSLDMSRGKPGASQLDLSN